MIFVILIFVAIVIVFVVLRRNGIGMGGNDGQKDGVYETLEENPSPKKRGQLIADIVWSSSVPMPDKTEGCYVILTYESKKALKSSLASYEYALVGKSAKDEAAAAARHLTGGGNETIASCVVEGKKPFMVALFACEEYGMDIDECESALRKVFGDERLLKNTTAAKKK